MVAELGKEPAVLKKDIAGFLCNRIGYAMYREAVYLLESGVADAEAIECSFRNSVGLWAAMCGPLPEKIRGLAGVSRAHFRARA